MTTSTSDKTAAPSRTSSVTGSTWVLTLSTIAFTLMFAVWMLFGVPAYLVSRAGSYGALLCFAFLAGFAGNALSVGIARNAVWTPRERQGFTLGLFGSQPCSSFPRAC